MIIMFLMDSTSVLPIRNIINMFTTESKHCILIRNMILATTYRTYKKYYEPDETHITNQIG